MSIDVRYIALLVWGGACLVAYGLVFWRRLHAFRRHRDERSRRELVIGFALFLTAICAAVSVAVVLSATAVFGGPGPSLSWVMGSIALGSFVAAGIVMVQETPRDRE